MGMDRMGDDAMSEGLCWKCKQVLDGLNEDKDVPPSIKMALPLISHCHHEPKKKPKCWCERDYIHDGCRRKFVVVELIDKNVGHEYRDALCPFLHCPECGRPL